MGCCDFAIKTYLFKSISYLQNFVFGKLTFELGVSFAFVSLLFFWSQLLDCWSSVWCWAKYFLTYLAGAFLCQWKGDQWGVHRHSHVQFFTNVDPRMFIWKQIALASSHDLHLVPYCLTHAVSPHTIHHQYKFNTIQFNINQYTILKSKSRVSGIWPRAMSPSSSVQGPLHQLLTQL